MRIVFQAGVVVTMAAVLRLPSATGATPVPAASLDLLPDDAPSTASVPIEDEAPSTLVASTPIEEPEPAPHTDAVIFLVLDGARWQETLVGTDPIFATGEDRGVSAATLMPNLHRMIDDGVVIGAPGHGPPMVASGPHFVSLPGYNEIFSGRPPSACWDNDCAATKLTTIVDEVRQTGEVAVFSSWAPIARAASKTPNDIFHSTGEPVTGVFRADRATADLALAYFAENRPSFFFLGLGEPDELAHKGDYAGYLGSLRQADEVLGALRGLLGAIGERGKHTSVFVTCDHGRADNFKDHGGPWPESSRVWLVAAGGAIPARGAVDSVRKHRLADLAPTVRALLGLPADRAAEAGAAIVELLPSQ